MLDLFLRGRADAERRDRWLAAEEIRAATIHHEEAGQTFGLGLSVGLEDVAELARQADLGADAIGMVVVLEGSRGLEECAEIGVSGLAGDFAGSHARVRADNGIEAEGGIRGGYLRVGNLRVRFHREEHR